MTRTTLCFLRSLWFGSRTSFQSSCVWLFRLTRFVQEGIDRANAEATSNAQRVQKFTILPTDFSVPGGELGPTLKLKRHYVLKKYENTIRNMYNV